MIVRRGEFPWGWSQGILQEHGSIPMNIPKKRGGPFLHPCD